MKRIIFTALILASSTATAQVSLPPLRVQNGGVNVPLRFRLNFVGGGCVDNSSARSTDCTITASFGGLPGVNSPLTGNGTSGSHLACPTCALTTTTLTAGTGLTGGGDLSTNRSFAIDGTVATLSGTQELTNKTLTGQVVKNGLTASGSVANDFSGSTGDFKLSTGAVSYSGAAAKTVSITTPGNTATITLTAGSAILKLDDNVGAQLFYGATSTLKVNSASTTITGNGSDLASHQPLLVDNAITFTVPGAGGIQNTNGASNGNTYFGLASGVASVQCAVAEEVLADTGGTTVNEVVVWSGANKVQNAAASTSLSTIAGVALTTASSGAKVKVCKRGRVQVNADAGITAGQLVSTSGTTAGNVQSTVVPVYGTAVGRATEATGGTTAGKVIVDVLLN